MNLFLDKKARESQNTKRILIDLVYEINQSDLWVVQNAVFPHLIYLV